MRDIDQLLSRSAPEPRRPLSSTFTTNVTRAIDAAPTRGHLVHAARTRQLLHAVRLRFAAKPAMAASSLLIAVLLSGSAYAAVAGWPSIRALFGGQKDEGGGQRIVKVDAQNCYMPSAFNILSKDKTASAFYYRINPGSKLTNAQVVTMVQGECELQSQEQYDQQVVQSALNANPLNKDKVVGGYADSEVTAISPTSISLRSHWPVGSTIQTINQTFPVTPDVLVYASPNKLPLSAVKVGDHVSIQYRASGDALTHSETIAPDQIDPSQQVVVTIIKNTPATTDAINFQKYSGREFEQVVPCASQPSGYCTAEQYFSKK